MPSSYCLILALLLLAPPVWAQEDASLTSATSALQSVLSSLKESTDKLSMDNERLTSRESVIKQQIGQLRTQLGQLQAQGEGLNKSVAQLQDKNPRAAQLIANLESENFDLDNRTQKAGVTIKSLQEALNAGYKEDQQLLLKLKTLVNPPAAAPMPLGPEAKAQEQRRKEKLRIMKMIYESQERQAALNRSIMDLQKKAPVQPPAAGAILRQQQLNSQIAQMQTEMAALPPENSPAAAVPQWSQQQLAQLEDETAALEKNYAQLKDLMAQMEKRSRLPKATPGQFAEREKLEGNIKDLNRQAKELRAQLDDLRAQMVDLDKRKTYLEAMIRQTL